MEDFRERFRKFIENVYFPSNADNTSISKKWNEIYGLLLPNIPEKLFRYRGVNDHSLNDFQNGTISLCHAGLYKDRQEYQHEHEWRLLYYNFDNEDNYYSIPDNNSLKAIFYGPDITDENRDKLHKIAQEKGIAEYNVSLDVDSRKYDLKITSIIE